MTYSLLQLSDNECQIYNETIQRDTNVGAVDTSDEWLFKNYKDIHNQYLNIFENSDSEDVKMEALKRMIFLNWYSVVEPQYLTGITDLEEKSMYKSYSLLNDYIELQKLDIEFDWMLKHYSSWKHLILYFSGKNLLALTSFVNSVDTSNLKLPQNNLPEEIMDNRGQMGIYWKSIIWR